MQTDMHYYGTYSMARAAGLDPDSCRIIATAAQFVDDNAGGGSVRFGDGGGIDFDATAHHTADVRNIEPQDQRQVWIPFHFLPGNQGGSYSERLLCRMDSEIARQMVDNHLSWAEKAYALPLLGIAAHVYGDTFSHYGFSGVSSRSNRIINDSIELDPRGELSDEIKAYIQNKAKSFMEKYGEEGGLLENFKSKLTSFAAETFSGALGHGAVLTYPDRPYLAWQFMYERPERASGLRDNPSTYLVGCRALHAMFKRLGESRHDLVADEGRNFTGIEETVQEILATQADMQGRIDAWQTAAQAGRLFHREETIPEYDENNWHHQRNSLTEKTDSEESVHLEVFQFYQAAAAHRTYVLRELLPAHGLVVA